MTPLQQTIASIQARPAYLKHHVLDGNRGIIVVNTTKGLFLLDSEEPSATKWSQITPAKAEELFDTFYFASYFNKFVAKETQCHIN